MQSDSSDPNTNTDSNINTSNNTSNYTEFNIHTDSDLYSSPFCMVNIIDGPPVKIYPEENTDDPNYTNSVLNILKKENIGPALHSLYRGITDPGHGFILIFDEFKFFSANEILEHQDVYDGKFIDIAIMYRGIGCLIVMSYIPKTNNFFFRLDEGTCAYDMEANFLRYSDSKFQPDKFELYKKHVHYTKDRKIEQDTICEERQYTYRDAMRILSGNKWVF